MQLNRYMGNVVMEQSVFKMVIQENFFLIWWGKKYFIDYILYL